MPCWLPTRTVLHEWVAKTPGLCCHLAVINEYRSPLHVNKGKRQNNLSIKSVALMLPVLCRIYALCH